MAYGLSPEGGSIHARHSTRRTESDLLELGPWGLRKTSYDDLDMVGHWRAYLDDPMRCLRHVL